MQMELAEQAAMFDRERTELLAQHDAEKARLREQCKQELDLLVKNAREQKESALRAQQEALVKTYAAHIICINASSHVAHVADSTKIAPSWSERTRRRWRRWSGSSPRARWR